MGYPFCPGGPHALPSRRVRDRALWRSQATSHPSRLRKAISHFDKIGAVAYVAALTDLADTDLVQTGSALFAATAKGAMPARPTPARQKSARAAPNGAAPKPSAPNVKAQQQRQHAHTRLPRWSEVAFVYG